MSYTQIKFSSQNKPDFIIELRKKVKDYFETNKLSKYGNPGIVAKSVLMTLVYFTPYVLMVAGVIQTLPMILLSFIMMGLGMAGLGMVLMHDSNHGTFSKNPRINRFLSNSLYFLGGFPPTWQYQHNTLHHGYTNIHGHDGDINPAGILRFSPHNPLKKIHKYQHLYAWFLYGLMTISWITTKDFKQYFSYKKSGAVLSGTKSNTQMILELVISKVLYYAIFLVIPLIVLPIAWYWILLFFFIMHFATGLMLSSIFQTAHVMPTSQYPLPDEDGNIENNWAVHQLLTTSNYAPESRIFSWLIGGLNYQVEHHLFPNISHVHYRNIAHIVKGTALEHGLPYYVQPSFLHAVKSHASMLKSLGR
ncbi:MAG: acyl-CoA desaturase [Bacteroidales bacterium]|nr:acyl-CoA desaturase [Bacteroidales bacterium]